MALVVASLAITAPPVPAAAAPGDPCPALAPVEATITVVTVDQPTTEADRNHLAGRVGAVEIDYLSPPGEPLDQSILFARAGLDGRARVTATTVDRSVLVSMRTTTAVVACVDDGTGAFEEVALSDGRLSFTGDPFDDPGTVQVTAGHLAVTLIRHRTERPVIEVALTGTLPPTTAGGDGAPAGDPIGARPPFVG